jgi:hypothetical protein
MNKTKSAMKQVQRIINHLFGYVGLRVSKLNNDNISHGAYIAVVKEVHDIMSKTLFTQLPRREGRIDLMSKLLGTGISQSMYIIHYLSQSLALAGDVCEFGVAQGATSALLANEIRTTDKALWLFDSFKGLPKPTEKDVLLDDIFNLGSMEKYEGEMAVPIREVVKKLQNISFPQSRTRVVPGFIEDTIKSADLPQKVCFAYVDFDFYSPIAIALSYLDRHLSHGGFIIVDDYGFFSAGAKVAVDEFMQTHYERYQMIMPEQFAGCFCILRKK